MSLIKCPECGHEVSTTATECPNCGRPTHRPIAPETVITAIPRNKESIPPWVFIPLGILGVLLLLVVFFMMSRSNDDSANGVNINVSAKRAATDTRVPARTDSQVVTVPPSSDAQTVTVPSSQQTTTTTVPGVAGAPAPPDRGTVVLEAKTSARTGAPQAVRNEKFYLLDKDLEMILSEADVEPIEGQTLMNSLGLSVLYPDRYGEFNRAALNAIKRHIKYSTQTDGSGRAQMKDIKPDSYYLFGVTRTGKGFAVWSAPVSINAGENVLNLSPQPLTEISE